MLQLGILGEIEAHYDAWCEALGLKVFATVLCHAYLVTICALCPTGEYENSGSLRKHVSDVGMTDSLPPPESPGVLLPIDALLDRTPEIKETLLGRMRHLQ